jgi:hypothetical protein
MVGGMPLDRCARRRPGYERRTASSHGAQDLRSRSLATAARGSEEVVWRPRRTQTRRHGPLGTARPTSQSRGFSRSGGQRAKVACGCRRDPVLRQVAASPPGSCCLPRGPDWATVAARAPDHSRGFGVGNRVRTTPAPPSRRGRAMPDTAALIALLILERPLCLPCIAMKVSISVTCVELALAPIGPIVWIRRRSSERCRACGDTGILVSLTRLDGERTSR